MVRQIGNRRTHLCGWLALGALLLAPAAWGEDAPASASEERLAALKAASIANTEALLARVEASAAFLAEQKRFAFRTRQTHDALQRNGQMLEFGAVQAVTVRRPDRARIETTDRDGDRRSLTFDGKTIAIDLPEANAYVSVEKPGTLEAAIEYLVDDLDTPAPLHELITDNYFDGARAQVLSGYFVDTEWLGEQECDHLAFRAADVDVQLWLRTGDEPLPCRIVITYTTAEGAPQFAADFEDWNLAPDVPDELFVFEPPEGAERLTLHAAQRQVAEGEEKP